MNVPDPLVVALVSLAGSQGLIVIGYVLKKLMEHERHRGRTEAMIEMMNRRQSETTR